MENYLSIIPIEILLLIVDYLNDNDDIYSLDNFIFFKSEEWKSLILNKNSDRRSHTHKAQQHIDVEKVVPINWNYRDDEGEYYKSIYLKMNDALSSAIYYLNPTYYDPPSSFQVTINSISNIDLLLIPDDLKWNKRICRLFVGRDVHGMKRLNFITGKLYVIEVVGSQIKRNVSSKYVLNILTHLNYNSRSVYRTI